MSTVLLRPSGANPDVRSMEVAVPAAVEDGGAGRGDASCVIAGAAHAPLDSPPGRAMKTSLEHLPHRKQKQLADVTATLCAMAPVEMVILFGSHARGDWVDDPVGIHTGETWEDDPSGGFHSDFDILAIVKTRKIAESHDIWSRIEDQLRNRLGNTELSLIVHDIKDVNRQLEKGQYFFGDVKKEGIVLYDSKRFVLADERDLPPEERVQLARVWFTDWFEEADGFLGASDEAFAKSRWKIAAFLLHQATERYYNTTQMVFTAYSCVKTDH